VLNLKRFSIEKMCSTKREYGVDLLTLGNILSNCKSHPFRSIQDTSQLVANSFFTNIYMNTLNENILFVLASLRDKCYQLFMEFRRSCEPDYKRMLHIKQRQNSESVNQSLNLFRSNLKLMFSPIWF
jgi:hypothetical protein